MAYQGVVDDFRACCEFGTPSRLPVFALGLEFVAGQAGLNCEDTRLDVDKVVQSQAESVERFDFDLVEVFPDDYIEFEPLGLAMTHDPEHPAMPSTYLEMTPEVLAGFRVPDAQREMRLPIHLAMIRGLKDAVGDRAVVLGRIAAPFSALGLIYGIDTLLVNMLVEPDVVRDNLAFFVAHQIAFGRAQFEAGADLLWLGDCVADSNFLSPEHYAEFAFDAAARVADALTRDGGLVLYHTCETSLPHLALQTDLPVSAVNVGEGADIAAIKQALGPKKCLTGNIDPMLLRDGTPETVAAATAAMIEANAVGGGYVFNTGEGVMCTSPADNIAAMMATAKALPACGAS